MKRKNLIATKKVKKNKLLFKNPKIQKFYVNFKSIIFKDIKYKSFAVAVSGGSDSLCLAYFSKIYSSEFSNKIHVIIVDHGDMLLSVYKHNSSLLKSQNELVTAGEVIALSGNQGTLTTGPHLHFELWKNGVPIDPEEFFNFK